VVSGPDGAAVFDALHCRRVANSSSANRPIIAAPLIIQSSPGVPQRTLRILARRPGRFCGLLGTIGGLFGDGWDRFRSLWAAYAPPREAFGSSLAAFRSRWDAMRFLHAPDPFPFRPDASFRVLLVTVPAPLGRHSVLVVPTSEHRGADPVPPGRQSVPAMAISATVGTGFVGYVSTLGYAPAFRPPNT
jgi:hypothetical protein